MIIGESLVNLVKKGKNSKIRSLNISANQKELNKKIQNYKDQLKHERKEAELKIGNLKKRYSELIKKMENQEKTIEDLHKQNSELRKNKHKEMMIDEGEAEMSSSQNLSESYKKISQSINRPMSHKRIHNSEFRVINRTLSVNKFELANQNEDRKQVTDLRNINKKKDYILEKSKVRNLYR